MKRLAATICLLVTVSALAQNPQSQTAPPYSVNAKYVNGVAPGYAPTAGTGLVLNLGPGGANCLGTMTSYAGGTLSLTASSINNIYLNTASSCAPAVKTSIFTSSDIPIASVITGPSIILTISDYRTMFTANNAPGSYLLLTGGTLTGALLGPSICSEFQPVINVLCYGADGSRARSATGSYTASSSTITVSGANFTTANIGWGVTLFDALPFGSPYGSPVTISATACNYPAIPVFPATTAPVTITAANSFRSTEHVLISGPTGSCTALNGRILVVDNSGLSGSSFQASIKDTGTFGGSDTFTGTRTMDKIATITAVTDSTHAVVSFTPTVTASNPKVGWWPDLCIPLQAALDAGKNSTYFASGVVGSKVPQLFFPQGEYHTTCALYQQHVQVQGIPGAGGTRVAWDGANHGDIPVEPVGATYAGIAHTYGTMWDRQSIGPGNSSLQGMEFYSDSPFFVPDYMLEWDQTVDHSTVVNQNHVFGSLVANMAVGVPLVNGQTIGGVDANLHWIQNRWDQICGDGVYIYMPPSKTRISMAISNSTADTGSTVEVAQNCKLRSVVAIDTGDVNGTGNPGIIHVSDMRIESQTATQFDTTDGPASWFRFVNQNKGTFSYVAPDFDFTDLRINNLSSQSTYILGSGNTNGFFCPHGTITNPRWGAGMAGAIGTSTTPANYACATSLVASTPINETGAFSSGAFGWIGTVSWGSTDPSTTMWVGNLPHNKLPNTVYAQNATDWTLGTGVTVATTGCDGIGNPCLSILGTGSAFAGATTSKTTGVPVTAGKVYVFGATPDCTNITSGIISEYMTDGVTTAYASCAGPGSLPLPVFNTFAPTTSTVEVGTSYRLATGANGLAVNVSAPFMYTGSTPYPYQPNTSFADATIPAAALPKANGSTQGIMKGDGSTLTCTAGVCSSVYQNNGVVYTYDTCTPANCAGLSANQSAQTMVSSVPGSNGAVYTFKGELSQASLGTGCAANSVQLQFSWTDLITNVSGARTVVLNVGSSATANLTCTAATSGTLAQCRFTYTFAAKSGTAITWNSTAYTATSCSPNWTYTLNPVLVQEYQMQ